jgi:hypothetical protein
VFTVGVLSTATNNEEPFVSIRKLVAAVAAAAAFSPAFAQISFPDPTDRFMHLEWFLPSDGHFWTLDRAFSTTKHVGRPISGWADVSFAAGADTGTFAMKTLWLHQHGPGDPLIFFSDPRVFPLRYPTSAVAAESAASMPAR